MINKDNEIKRKWEIDLNELPTKKNVFLRTDRFENLIQSEISQGNILVIIPNVFKDFIFPTFQLKLHFRPFDKSKVRLIYQQPNIDQELAKLFFEEKRVLKVCLSMFKYFFPKDEVESVSYLENVSCPLCLVENAFTRYLTYGALLKENFYIVRRMLVSFHSIDFAEILDLGGVLRDKEAVMTIIGLKSPLESLKSYSGNNMRILEYRQFFYLINLKFDFTEPVWDFFKPVYENVVNRYFLWEPLNALVPSLLPFLQNEEKFKRLVNFYSSLSQIYSSLKRRK